MAPKESEGLVNAHNNQPSSELGRYETGFKCYPAGRDDPIKSWLKWIKGKQIDDNVGPYWRVHDKLYDLTSFVRKHPGGKDWLEVTQGTDITEAFESSHIGSAAEKILPKYYVKDATTVRNSPFTFHEDGFYRTLKKRVRPLIQKIGTGPTRKVLMIQDGLALAFVSLILAACTFHSYLLAVFSGIFLAMTIICAHNFFHQRDNWRMYLFDLSLLSSCDWRISHALSHHLFTNTIYDVEVSGIEPFLEFLPKQHKSLLQRYGSYIYEALLLPLVFPMEFVKKFGLVALGKAPFRLEYLLPVIELLIMVIIVPPAEAFGLWLVLHCSCSTWFAAVGLVAGHHHPDIYHEGDRMRENPDWGLCQLDAVRDRLEVTGSLFLVVTAFGDHSLHHLFPTVDHSKLHHLYPVFKDTCQEFDIPFTLVRQWYLMMGQYRQLAKNTPNTVPPGYKRKLL